MRDLRTRPMITISLFDKVLSPELRFEVSPFFVDPERRAVFGFDFPYEENVVASLNTSFCQEVGEAILIRFDASLPHFMKNRAYEQMFAYYDWRPNPRLYLSEKKVDEGIERKLCGILPFQSLDILELQQTAPDFAKTLGQTVLKYLEAASPVHALPWTPEAKSLSL